MILQRIRDYLIHFKELRPTYLPFNGFSLGDVSESD